LRNVQPVRIDPLDDGRLPFDDNSFDVVVLNGVLEYVGAAALDLTPAEVQKRCLKEVRRVLKPGGTLYVGIENRFGYLYFMGSHDHNGLRFTSLLPRKLASWVTQWRKGTPYRTYTYSSAGYTALLHSAGFQTPEFHLAIPTYREPRYIVPADNQNAIVYFARQHAYSIKRRVRRALVSAMFRNLPVRLSSGLMRRVADSYLILAVPNK
jgi:SAM-dependent methyltransferase